MEVTDPTPLLAEVDIERLESILGRKPSASTTVSYVEPGRVTSQSSSTEATSAAAPQTGPSKSSDSDVVKGKVITMGDYIDTDALAPAEALVNARMSTEELGTWCMRYTQPEFRGRVKDEGLNIVVAGDAFGVGSSREAAVQALQGAGVKAVIAKSFAFIYGRNQANFGLVGCLVKDEDFYTIAKDGEPVEVDLEKREIRVGGKSFNFQFSELERRLIETGGVSEAFKKWGKGYMEMITTGKTKGGPLEKKEDEMSF